MKHCFNVKGAFKNGVRLYNIETQSFLRDLSSNDSLFKDFIRRMLTVIYSLAKLGIVHGDLKPENILVE